MRPTMVGYRLLLSLILPARAALAFIVPQQQQLQLFQKHHQQCHAGRRYNNKYAHHDRNNHKQQQLFELDMTPKFDPTIEKFVPMNLEKEGPNAGYPPIGSLLRQGPQPYIQRIFNPDDYEQAVLKFMAMEQCDRNEAQGNMDAYLRNANDWAYTRAEQEKKGNKVDYVTLDTEEVVLTITWAIMATFFITRGAYCLYVHEHFWEFLNR